MPAKRAQTERNGERYDFDEKALDRLLREYETMQNLFIHTENSAQSIFNFYLTLITTVIGGILLVGQFGEISMDRQLKIISLLMVFASGVGIVYLSAISGRYAHMLRYAKGIDALRRTLLRDLKDNLPPIYQVFVAKEPKTIKYGWLRWIFPTGAYELFIAVVNSLSISLAIWFFLSAFQVTSVQFLKSLITIGVIFFFSFFVFNIYSNYIIFVLDKHLNIQIDASSDFNLTIGKF